MGVDMAKMLDAPLVQVPEDQRNKAIKNVVWMNRDDPESIPEMLRALGLMTDARKLRAS